ncbi:MAG: rhomboid family intramembrane serine protease [Bacteroidia bacterium]
MIMQYALLLESPVSLALLVSIVLAGIAGLIWENLRDKHTLVPYDMIAYREYWRLLTSGFMHGSYIHLLFNAITFYFFAFLLEARLGHWQFLVLYLLSLLLSNLAVTLIYRRDTAYEGSVGASGAISGVVLSCVLVNPYLQFGLPVLSDLYPALRLPAWIVAAVYLGYTLFGTLRRVETRINHHAHLWGAIAGIALTFALKPSAWRLLAAFFRDLV